MKKILSIKKTCPSIACLLIATFCAMPLSVTASLDSGENLKGIEHKDRTANSPPQEQTVEVVGETDRPERAPVQAEQKDTARVWVKGFVITGQSVYTEDALQEIIAGYRLKELTFAEIKEAAARITTYYHQNGYIATRAYIPEQTIEDDVVLINIVEGRYGQIQIENTAKISQGAVKRAVGNLQTGDIVNKKALEKAILSLNDLYGVKAKALIKPGGASGTTDVTITVTDGKQFESSIYTNNYGSKYTGEYLTGVEATFPNIGGIGDILSISGETSSGWGNKGGSVVYEVPLWRQGLTGGFGYSKSSYSLGKEFDVLDASGKGNTLSFFLNQSLVRSYNTNLSLRLSYDRTRLEDAIGLTDDQSVKYTNKIVAALYGNSTDSLGRGGYNMYSLSFSRGKLKFADEWDEFWDSYSGVNSAGRYEKYNLSLKRMQYLNQKFHAYASLRTQWASKNLTSAEKMNIGGPYGVRAYSKDEISADEGTILTLELRYDLLADKKNRQNSKLKNDDMYLVLFYDIGRATFNKKPWYDDENKRTLSGVGLGWTFQRPENFILKMSYAWKTGSRQSVVDPDKNGRLLFEVSKLF